MAGGGWARLRGAALPGPGPVRPLAVAALTGRVGRGLVATVLPLYLTRAVGLAPGQVAVGLTLASLGGMACGVPAGYLCDLAGPNRLRVAARIAEGLLLCGYAAVGGFTWFLVVACLVTAFESSGLVAEAALIAGSAPPRQRVRTRAYLRAVNNAGWSVGALLAGAALTVDTRAAYTAALVVAALCYLASAAATARVPPVPPVARGGGPRWTALRDGPFVLLTVLNGVLGMNLGVFTVALPLFIAARTGAPVVLYSVLVLLNTVCATLFQVRASRGSDTVAGAAGAQRRAGVLLAGCCALFALADGRAAGPAAAVLVAGCAVQVAAELFQAAGSWGLSFELAPEHAIGQYQGLYGIGRDLGLVLTPLVATGAMVGWGGTGCLALGALFAAAGLAVPPVARRAGGRLVGPHARSRSSVAAGRPSAGGAGTR